MARVLAGGTANYLEAFDAGGILDAGTDNFTYGGWFKPTSNSGVSQVVWAKWNGTTGWIMFMISSGILRCQINTGGVADTPAALTLNVWHHLMATVTTGALTLYVNGSQSAQDTTPGTLGDTAHDFLWGRRNLGATAAANGNVAEFMAWSAILTTAEIAALAKGASPLNVRPKNFVWVPGWGAAGTGGGEPDLGGTGYNPHAVGGLVAGNHAPVGCPFPLAY